MTTEFKITTYLRSKLRDHTIKDDHTHEMKMWYFLIIDYRNYNLKNPNHVITTFEILLSKNKDDRKRHSPKLVNRAFFSVYTPKKRDQRYDYT